MKRYVHFYIFIFLLHSCAGPFDKSEIFVTTSKKSLQGISKVQVGNVDYSNNEFVVDGVNLEEVKTVKMVGDGVSEDLIIKSANDDKVTLQTSSDVSIVAGKILNLIFTDAHGATSTYTLTLTVKNNSVGASQIIDDSISLSKLSRTGVNSGDVIQFNGSNWSYSNLNGLSYSGTWDATGVNTSDTTDLTLVNCNGKAEGDYFVVSVSGTSNINGENTWTVGDWVICSNSNWVKIANSTMVTNVFGRTGAVSAALSDLDDVLVTTPADGEILIFNNANSRFENMNFLKFNVATGEGTFSQDLIVTGNLSVNSQNVCLADGTNCPAPPAPSNLSSSSGTVSIDATTGSDDIDLKIGGTTYLKVDNSGNVGIGDLAPTNKLSVIDIENTSSGSHTIASFKTGNTANDPYISFGYNADGADSTANTITSGNSLPLIFKTDLAPDALTILDNGNVGVGNINPSEKLDVNGNIRAFAICDEAGSNCKDISTGWSGDAAAAILAGFVTGANSTVLNTDTVEVAIEKLQGQVDAKEDIISIGTTAQYYRGDKSWQTLDKASVGLTNVDNVQQLPLSLRDNGALSTSTTTVPTSNAVKTYVDAQVGGGGSQWITTGSDIYYTTGKVGIGVNNPSFDLEVDGTIVSSRTQAITTVPDSFGHSLLNASGQSRWIMRSLNNEGGSNTGFDLVFHARTDGGSQLGNHMLIQRSTGNVGIGRTAPSAKLDVNGNIRATEICDETGANCKDVSAGWASGSSGSYGASVSAPNDTAYTTDEGNLRLGNKLIFSSNVDLNDASNGMRLFGGTNSMTLGMCSNSICTTGLNYLELNRGAGEANFYGMNLLVSASGSATSPDYSFGGDTDTGMFSSTGDTLGFTTGGVERLAIDSSGNIGIGTTTPNAKLDVNGNIRATEICDEAGSNCKDISAGWSSGDPTASVLSGFVTGANSSVTNADTIEVAIEKIQGQLNAKEGSISAGTTAQYLRGDKSWQTLDKSAVGLSNVDNTQQLALTLRDNGALSTSTTTVPTSGAVKTYVDSAVGGVTSSQWTTNGSDIFYSTGSVGIGTNTPSQALHVVGNIFATGYIQPSDERLKKEISKLENALSIVKKLDGVKYYWRHEEYRDLKLPTELHYGLIAQELERYLPHLVTTNDVGYKAVNYQGLIPYLIEALKELDNKQNKINREIAAIKEQNELLKEQNEILKKLLNKKLGDK